MSKIASAHGGDDHDKASSFMSETLEKVHAKPCLPGLSYMPGLAKQKPLLLFYLECMQEMGVHGSTASLLLG